MNDESDLLNKEEEEEEKYQIKQNKESKYSNRRESSRRSNISGKIVSDQIRRRRYRAEGEE